MSEPVRVAVIIEHGEVRVCTFGVPVEAIIIDYEHAAAPPSGYHVRQMPGSEHPFCEMTASDAACAFWPAERLQPEEVALLGPMLEELKGETIPL